MRSSKTCAPGLSTALTKTTRSRSRAWARRLLIVPSESTTSRRWVVIFLPASPRGGAGAFPGPARRFRRAASTFAQFRARVAADRRQLRRRYAQVGHGWAAVRFSGSSLATTTTPPSAPLLERLRRLLSIRTAASADGSRTTAQPGEGPSPARARQHGSFSPEAPA